MKADHGARGNLVGESGRSQITFGEQKLQLRHNELLGNFQLFTIHSEDAALKILSGRGECPRPWASRQDINQFGCRRRNAGMSR
jgi:hypothetical protein